jgi:hypothetical protein
MADIEKGSLVGRPVVHNVYTFVRIVETGKQISIRILFTCVQLQIKFLNTL